MMVILTPWWWFKYFFIFTPTWGNDPISLIFFRLVETTNWTPIVLMVLGIPGNLPFLFYRKPTYLPSQLMARFPDLRSILDLGCGDMSWIQCSRVEKILEIPTWRIIPFSKGLITMVSKSLTGVVPFTNGLNGL